MKIILAIFFLTFSYAAQAKYFFMINDYDQTNCLYTELNTKTEIEMRLESSSNMECTGVEDKKGSIIMTCKGILTNMYVFANTKSTCESMHKSFKTIMEN